MVSISPPDGCCEESLYVTMCSPSWFAARLAHDEFRNGPHTIFMHEYDCRKLYAFAERATRLPLDQSARDFAD